jgi:Protein of unknown function (DUF669)
MADGIGPLNLADADMKGFEPLEPGRYNAEVFEITMDAVRNPTGTGKMPAGTPMVKVQFKITDEGVENRRVWSQYIIPPKNYDAAKAAKIKGMLARFFVALGESEEKVLSKSFEPDLEDYVGRECVVVVGREPKRDGSTGEIIEGEYNNPVKGVKPAGSIVGTSGGQLL